VTPAEAKRFRHAWRRGGLPGFRTAPPQPPVPSPRPSAEEAWAGRDAEALERVVRTEGRLLDTGEIAAIWDGWKEPQR
jgi:hypothetical protein